MASIDLSGFSGSSLTGLISGLDTNAIVQAAVAAKQVPVTELAFEQSENTAQIAALKLLKANLGALQDLADGLRNPPGVNNQDENAFLYKKVSVTGSPTNFDNATDLLAVSTEPGALETDYTIEITQLAAKELERFTGFTTTGDLTDGGTPEVTAGSIQINSVEVTIADGASLTDIENAINALSSEHGVTASIVTITPESADDANDGSYTLQLSSNDTGADNTIVVADFATVFTNGITHDDDTVTLESAQNAIIEFDGNTINRSSNVFDDVVENVTFNLLNAEAGTELNVDITKDSSVAESQIQNFFASVNQNLIFFANQQNRDSITGDTTAGAVLFDSPMLKTLAGTFKSEIGAIVSGVSGDYNSASSIGFGFELFEGEDVDGNADSPQVALFSSDGSISTKLTNDYEDVRDVFELQFSATGANDILALSSASNDLTTSSFSLSIDINNAEGERVTITNGTDVFYGTFDPYDDDDLTAGGVISGVDGTAIAGLNMIYTGDGVDSNISVNISQGIAARVYNLVEGYTDFLGIIDQQILQLQDRNDDLDDEIVDLEADIATFQQDQINIFAKLEAAVSQANATLGFIEAFANAQNNQ